MRNILFGGKMGDFIHSLILPKYLYDTTGEIFNIYITNTRWEVFASGIDTSYKELYPVIKKQPYVNDFQIHTNENIDIDLFNISKEKHHEIIGINTKEQLFELENLIS